MRAALTLLLLLSSLSWAQAGNQDKDEAILSYIEDLADPRVAASEKDPRRLISFVEMIHAPSLRACQKQGFKNCEPFEVSAPFLPEGQATDFEKTLVREWLRLVARTSLRLQLETGALPAAVGCVLGGFDLGWYLYTGELFFPKEDFCSGFGLGNILPNCFFECDIPLINACPEPPGECPKCVAEGYARATKTMYADYYPEYIKNGLQAMVTVMPLATVWGDVNRMDFSLLQPVASLNLNLQGVLDLAREAQSKDLRGAAYILQGGLRSPLCQPTVPLSQAKTMLELLRRIPGEGLDVTRPGLPPLEELKRHLADRESAGDSATRLLEALTKFDGEEFNPKYAKGGGGLLGSGKVAKTGTTLPLQYSCLGYATLFKVYPKMQTEAIGGGVRIAVCWAAFPLPGVTLVPFPPAVLAAPRLHTDWLAVPEGYPIPGIRGKFVY